MRIFLFLALYMCACGFAADPTAIPSQQIKIGRSILDVECAPGRLDLSASAVMKWITNATHAVARYYGQFPVRRAGLKINISRGDDGVLGGTAWGREDGSFTRVELGQHTTQEQLNEDWTLTHEFVHLGFPSVPRQQHWIEEGIATYVEPIARVQAGELKPETIWRDMVCPCPKASRKALIRASIILIPGDARTGVALSFASSPTFRSGNRPTTARACRTPSGPFSGRAVTSRRTGPLLKHSSLGDTATGVHVLMQLYDQMKGKPVQVDLPALWKRLGVEMRDRTVVFDDKAPLAPVRRAITAIHPA